MSTKRSNPTAKTPATPAFSKRFTQALTYAARIHGKQIRKRTERPYIGHLLGVASIVIEYGGDEDMAIAALLHDAVEDQGGIPASAKSAENSASAWLILSMAAPIPIPSRSLPGWSESALMSSG